MIIVEGTQNKAVCYCKDLEKSAAGQIKELCDQGVFANSKICIMPDVHTGMGCTIGTTMTITDKVVPGMVGVDIGCGMETVIIAQRDIDLAKLDKVIHKEIPSGRSIRQVAHPLNGEIDLTQLRCAKEVSLARATRSIGTLGGGNHFIEVNRGEDGTLYIVVHSGSRHLGNEVAKYYQNEGFNALCGGTRQQIDETIAKMKEEGNTKEIHNTIKKLKQQRFILTPVPKDLAYVEGAMFNDYMHDMQLIQQFATLNRKAIMQVIIEKMCLTPVEEFTTIHNYIDTESMILRKGAVSAKLGEKLLIPINMRDGSLVCIGLGNEAWNSSAPHGAGRLMSRRDAFEKLSMEEYKKEMEGIFSTCIVGATLDESPMAYKPMDDIVELIKPTAKIISHIKPIYNFKATQ